MNDEFRRIIRRAMAQYEADGVDCRIMQGAELQEYNEAIVDDKIERTPIEQIPFAERVKQCEDVRRIAEYRKCKLSEACFMVGITYANFKCVESARKRGKTHR